MSPLLLTSLMFASFSAISQTTVFNEGWDTQPVELLCAGATSIAYETNNQGMARFGKMIKYKMSGNEFVKTGEIRLAEILVDYRFDAHNKLQVIGHQPSHCDYYDSTDFRVYTIDTATFSIDTTRRLMFIDDFEMVSFANDSTLILANSRGSKIYSLTSNQIIQSNLFTQAFNSKSFIRGIFGGRFIMAYNRGFGLTLEATNTNLYNFAFGLSTPSGVYSYGLDSILLVTDSFAYKMDTFLYPIHSTAIPYHTRSKIIENRLYLLNNNLVYTYTLPGLNAVSTDTLKGLPNYYGLVDISITGSIGDLAALAETNLSNPLRHMALTADLNSTGETERHEVRMDSLHLLAVSPAPVNLAPYNKVVTFELFARNQGSDTIRSLNVLYRDYPDAPVGIAFCGAKRDEYISISIPPGETRSFIQDVRISNSLQNFCFHLSVPGHRIENDLSDNSICQSIHIGLEEKTPQNLYRVYPNPTAETITIEGERGVVESVELFAPDGRKVKVGFDHLDGDALVCNLSSLNSGVYYLRLVIEGQAMITRVVKN